MNLPELHVSITNRTKQEVLDVLQGVSRYISGILVERAIVDHEGVDIFLFLKNRYPTKELALNLSSEKEITPELMQLTRHQFIRTVAISAELKNCEQLIESLHSQKKKVILTGINFNLKFLEKNKIKNLFFFQSQPPKATVVWDLKILDQIKKLAALGYHIEVGSISAHNVAQFQKLPIHTLVIREDLCNSFNSIATCKDIFQQVKNYFLDEDA